VIGTQWLMRWLTLYGRSDIAFTLATNRSYPGWGYMAENGATTIWELWNGNTANPAMNSQNHVMLLGDLLIWMYEDLAGIRSDYPEHTGFKKIIMKPAFPAGLNEVNASYQSPYGLIKSHWKKENGNLNWTISLPANTSARIYLPANSEDQIRDSGKAVLESKGIRLIKKEKDFILVEIESGDYSFTTTGIPI
jgi:alpha-L-rhamnosidase